MKTVSKNNYTISLSDFAIKCASNGDIWEKRHGLDGKPYYALSKGDGIRKGLSQEELRKVFCRKHIAERQRIAARKQISKTRNNAAAPHTAGRSPHHAGNQQTANVNQDTPRGGVSCGSSSPKKDDCGDDGGGDCSSGDSDPPAPIAGAHYSHPLTPFKRNKPRYLNWRVYRRSWRVPRNVCGTQREGVCAA
jgi:hypothetical protein